MMVQSYSKLEGGFQSAPNMKVLGDRCKRLVLYTNGNHIAAAGCLSRYGNKEEEHNFKLTSVGSDGSEIGKYGVGLIVKKIATMPNPTNEMPVGYWCECSGAVEHLFKKYGGNPINTKYAHLYLNGSFKIISDTHYERKSENGTIFTKMIFGFTSPEVYKKVTEDLNEFLNFKEMVNKQPTLREDNGNEYYIEIYNISYFVVDTILKMQEKYYTNDITPLMEKQLRLAINNLNKMTGFENQQQINMLINKAMQLINGSMVLTLHKI